MSHWIIQSTDIQKCKILQELISHWIISSTDLKKMQIHSGMKLVTVYEWAKQTALFKSESLIHSSDSF